MEITLRIPDELARLIGMTGDIERRAPEALALHVFRQGHLSRSELRQMFRQGHLSRSELRQLLGFATRGELDAFLTAHRVFGTYTPADLARDRRDLARLGF